MTITKMTKASFLENKYKLVGEETAEYLGNVLDFDEIKPTNMLYNGRLFQTPNVRVGVPVGQRYTFVRSLNTGQRRKVSRKGDTYWSRLMGAIDAMASARLTRSQRTL